MNKNTRSSLTNNIDTKEELRLHKRLRTEIQQRMQADVVTSRFFAHCATEIFREEHARVSISTLKRYWQYVRTSQDYCPNRYTLNVLAHFAGYSSWQTFSQGQETSRFAEQRQTQLGKMEMALTQMENQIATLQLNVAELRKLLSQA